MSSSRRPGRNRQKSRADSSLLARLSMSRLFNARLRIWSALLALVLLAVVIRLICLQVFRHSYYLGRAKKSHVRELTIYAPRGSFLDRNGKTLAMSLPQKAVFADPDTFRKNLPPTRKNSLPSGKAGEKFLRLASLLQMSPSELRKTLDAAGSYLVLKSVPHSIAKAVEDLKLNWVGIETKEKRLYPFGAMAAQTLGFVNAEGKGLAGIEYSRNSWLAAHPGKVSVEVDAKGRPIPGLRAVKTDPRSGRDINLTIEASLQQIAEAELAKAIQASSAVGGAAIIMDPYTGEILALASQPAFDPNCFKEARPQRWVNPTVVAAYEPGSTFKLVIACSLLEEGIPLSSTRLVCTGEKPIGRRVIHCALHGGTRAHGEVDLEKIIEKSCNIGAATNALRLGKEKFYHYVKLLGFGEKTGIELGGESAGQVPDLSAWSDICTANIAFGQSISVTPIQLLRAYCAVANGGWLVKPHLIRTDEPQNAERILSEATTERLRNYFIQVVEKGTGEKAAIQGYLVAGKTGTAQKPVPGLGFRGSKESIGSFVGFVPADKPRLAILVMIDEPAGRGLGGVVAAPVFREIARQALLRLEIPPRSEEVAARASQPSVQRSSYSTP